MMRMGRNLIRRDRGLSRIGLTAVHLSSLPPNTPNDINNLAVFKGLTRRTLRRFSVFSKKDENEDIKKNIKVAIKGDFETDVDFQKDLKEKKFHQFVTEAYWIYDM